MPNIQVEIIGVIGRLETDDFIIGVVGSEYEIVYKKRNVGKRLANKAEQLAERLVNIIRVFN